MAAIGGALTASAVSAPRACFSKGVQGAVSTSPARTSARSHVSDNCLLRKGKLFRRRKRLTPLLPGAAAGDASAADQEDPYDPEDLAVSDEPVPDDILETLAARGGEGPGTAGTPEFAAVTPGGFSGFDSPGAAQAAADEERDELEGQRRDLKLTLVDSVFGLDRGFRASSEARAEVAELVAQLEALNPVPSTTEAASILSGRWILLYTSFSEVLPLLAVGQLPLVRVGDVVQEVDTGSATVLNSVSFIGPFSSTTFEASATFEIRSPKRLQIKFQEGTISPPRAVSTGSSSSISQLPSSIDIFGQKLDLAAASQALVQPLQSAASAVLGVLSGLPPLKFQLGSSGAQSWLLTTYLDEDLRVSRGDGGGLFVLIKEGSAYQY